MAGRISSSKSRSGIFESKLSAPSIAIPGAIEMFAGSSAPQGWMLCDGSAISRTTYPALYAAIGTTYGVGDNSTTFNLPNFQGIFPKGHGSQTIGSVTYTGTRGTVSGDKMQGHKHSVNANEPGEAAHTYFYTLGSTLTGTRDTNSPVSDGSNGTPRTGTITEPANLGVNFIIKL